MEHVKMQNGNRVDSVDYLRCYGIILMIMGHVWFGRTFDQWIHAFHMPLWFFVSGFFLNTEKKFTDFLWKKVKSLLFPYLLFSVIYIAISGFVTGAWSWQSLLWPNSIQIPFNAALWFLLALFWADILCFVLIKYLYEKAAVVIIALIAVFQSIFQFRLPLAIDSALVGMGFFCCAYALKIWWPQLFKLKKEMAVLLLAATTILTFLNGTVNLRSNEYNNILLFWVTAVGLLLAYWNIFRFFSERFTCNVLLKIGSDSLLYVCANQVIIYVLNMIYTPDHVLLLLAWKAVETVAVIVICYVLNKMISKSVLKVMLGKW